MNFKAFGTKLLLIGLVGFLAGLGYYKTGDYSSVFTKLFFEAELKAERETLSKYWGRGGFGDRSAIAEADANRATRAEHGKLFMLIFGIMGCVGLAVRSSSSGTARRDYPNDAQP